MKHYKHFINSIWTNQSFNKQFDTENLYTGEVQKKIAEGNLEEVNKDVLSVKNAHENIWRVVGLITPWNQPLLQQQQIQQL